MQLHAWAMRHSAHGMLQRSTGGFHACVHVQVHYGVPKRTRDRAGLAVRLAGCDNRLWTIALFTRIACLSERWHHLARLFCSPPPPKGERLAAATSAGSKPGRRKASIQPPVKIQVQQRTNDWVLLQKAPAPSFPLLQHPNPSLNYKVMSPENVIAVVSLVTAVALSGVTMLQAACIAKRAHRLADDVIDQGFYFSNYPRISWILTDAVRADQEFEVTPTQSPLKPNISVAFPCDSAATTTKSGNHGAAATVMLRQVQSNSRNAIEALARLTFDSSRIYCFGSTASRTSEHRGTDRLWCDGWHQGNRRRHVERGSRPLSGDARPSAGATSRAQGVVRRKSVDSSTGMWNLVDR